MHALAGPDTGFAIMACNGIWIRSVAINPTVATLRLVV